MMAGKGESYGKLTDEGDFRQAQRYVDTIGQSGGQLQQQPINATQTATNPMATAQQPYVVNQQQQPINATQVAIIPIATAQQPYVVNQQPILSTGGVQPGLAGVPIAPGMPGMVQLMPVPPRIQGCPPGLEYLAQLDQVLVHQQIELAEVFTNFEFENKYVIKNSLGQQMYFAREESECCERYWCRSARGFAITIQDNIGQEVIRVVRTFKCFAGCCWCANTDHCAFFVAVESPPGNVIGYVRQTQSRLSPHFDILDANQMCVLKVRGHWCRCQAICCTDDIDFKLMTTDLSTQVGKISKQWGGWVQESFTKADNFGVEFPKDMDVKIKAVALAGTFLIDFMFFENRKKNKHH